MNILCDTCIHLGTREDRERGQGRLSLRRLQNTDSLLGDKHACTALKLILSAGRLEDITGQAAFKNL